MKAYSVKSFVLWSVPAIALALLGSCGGSDYGGGSSSSNMPGAAATTTFNATLTGAQEVPPTGSSATGTATVTVDAAKGFTVAVTTTGIVGTAAHIHYAAVGVNGPIVVPLAEMPAGSGKWAASGTFDNTQYGYLNTGNYYVNVHSAAFPGGEIRGQLKTPSGSPY